MVTQRYGNKWKPKWLGRNGIVICGFGCLHWLLDKIQKRERTSFSCTAHNAYICGLCCFVSCLGWKINVCRDEILPENRTRQPAERTIVSGQASTLIQLVRQCPMDLGFRHWHLGSLWVSCGSNFVNTPSSALLISEELAGWN